MRAIRFTQYLRPNGRKADFTIERHDHIADKADALVAAGCALEIEVLMDDATVSMTVEREDDDGEVESLGHQLVKNGPGVPDAVDRLIEEATANLAQAPTR